jgi:hypothetical protein
MHPTRRGNRQGDVQQRTLVGSPVLGRIDLPSKPGSNDLVLCDLPGSNRGAAIAQQIATLTHGILNWLHLVLLSSVWGCFIKQGTFSDSSCFSSSAYPEVVVSRFQSLVDV